MRKFFKEFKEFISRGNILDLAIAFVMGTAFSAIVTALVNNVIMPLITAIFGVHSVAELAFTLNGTIIPIGLFVQAVIDFLLIALFLFLIIKSINSAKAVAEKGKQKHVTKEERAEIEKMGTVNMKNRKEVYAAAVELREKKKAEEEAAKKAEEDAKVTTEKLLTEIRDLLKNQKTEKAETKKTAKK